MTSEEAICELSVIRERLSHPEDCENGCYSFRDGNYTEALDMAIEALSEPSGDLISRADAIKAIRKCKFESDMPSYWYRGMEDAQDIIENIPSADADVVRCKDCKQRRVEGNCTNYYYCDFLGSICGDNEYCSFGERREP